MPASPATSAPDERGTLGRRLAGALAWARIGIGAAVWLVPRGSMRVLGFDPDDAALTALARLAGTRDLALGGIAVATLRRPGAAAAVARLNAAVDTLDAAAFAVALARREGIDRAALLGVAGGATAAAAGAWVGSRHQAPSSHQSKSL